jgi:hypothetical protein
MKRVFSLIFICIFGLLTACNDNKIGTSSLFTGQAEEEQQEAGFSDDFSDPASFADWECIDKDNWDQDGSGSTSDDCNSAFAIGGGSLTITARGADVWGTTHQFAGFYKRDLTGDFDFGVQVVSMTTTPNAWSKFGFFVANDATNFNSGGYVMCAQTVSNRVTQQWSSTGNGSINQSGSDSNNNTPKYLRLQKIGNTINCYFKEAVGAAWTLHSQSPLVVPSLNGVFDVGLIATSHNTGAELIITMDDFQDLSL